MRFKKWLEVVKRYPIVTNRKLEINYINPEEDWELAGHVEMISNKVGIRSNRNKDVSIIAMIGDQVIGGVQSEIYEEDRHRAYDFDVVVDPQWQGFQRVGLQLIKAAINEANNSEVSLIRTFVVNTRLIPILINRYGFEGEETGRPTILYKYV